MSAGLKRRKRKKRQRPTPKRPVGYGLDQLTIREDIEGFLIGEEGLYKNIPEGTYHAKHACSSSSLKQLARAPAILRAYQMDKISFSGSHFDFGSAAHIKVLEPHLFSDEVVMAGQCSATTSKGKQCSRGGQDMIEGKWYCTQHAPSDKTPQDVIALSKKDYENVLGVGRTVTHHAAAKKILDMDGYRELTALWYDPGTGMLCKARIDIFAAKGLGDLKTTRDASYKGFKRSYRKYDYYRQAAFYLRAAAHFGFRAKWFKFIAVEKEPPYLMNVFQAGDESLERGGQEINNLLALWKRCQEKNNWPGYREKVIEMEL